MTETHQITEKMNMPKLWTKDFINITITNLFIAFNFYILMVVTAGYAMDTFGVSPSIAGLATGIFIIGGLVARLFSGRWTELIGRKKTLYSGLILNLVITLSYFAVNNIFFLITVRFFHGVSFGIATTAVIAAVADIIPKQRLGEGIGYFSLSTTLSTAIGPFLSIFLSQHGGFNIILIISVTAIAFSILCASLSTVREIELTEGQVNEMKGFKLTNFFELKVIPISVICLIVYFCYSSVLSFLAKYSEEVHLVESASFFFLVVSIVVFCSRPFVGKVFDSKGENVIMYLAILASTIGLIGISQAHYGYFLLLTGVIFGLGFGAILPCCQAIYIKLTPQHRVGIATATFFIFIDFGVGIGPPIFGLFISSIGYRGMYLCAAIISAACIFLYYLLHGKNRTIK